jgi:hypothetical protein
MLEKRRPDIQSSEFSAFLDLVPDNCKSMSFFMKDSDLNELKGTSLKVDIQEEQEELKSEYAEICSLVPDFK